MPKDIEVILNKNKLLYSAILALVITVYPPIDAYIDGGVDAIVRYFMPDTFYYLSVAANSSFGQYTFDGLHQTNGFHPLWQYLLQLAVQVAGPRHGAVPMKIAFGLSIIFTGIGAALIGATITRATKSIWPALLIFPGAYFLCASQLDGRVGTIWSFVNGMESPLSVFGLGLLLFFLSFERAPRTALSLLALGAISGLILLSRLDDVFLVATTGVWIFYLGHRRGGMLEGLKSGVLFGLPVAVPLALYLSYNLQHVGVLMPTSGAAKFGFSALLTNLRFLADFAVPGASTLQHYLGRGFDYHQVGAPLGWRLGQMLIPAAAAVGLIFWGVGGLRKPTLSAPESTDLTIGPEAPLLAYVIIKSAYNFLFVQAFESGQWYYATAILIIDTLIAIEAGRWASAALTEHGRRLFTVAAGLAAWLSVGNLSGRALDDHHRFNVEFLHRADIIRTELDHLAPNSKIVEFDDGILNFGLRRPTLSGFGLAGDPGANAALRAGRFLSLASARGYSVIGTNYYSPLSEYTDAELATLKSDQINKILKAWGHLDKEIDLNQFIYGIIYRDSITGAAFISFHPR